MVLSRVTNYGAHYCGESIINLHTFLMLLYAPYGRINIKLVVFRKIVKLYL